ncbi:MAG: adenylosuccinate synthase [Planctomycetota bacterium]
MSATALIGLQWGDEGKGKMVDILAAEAELVVRCQGGSNAGHTVEVAGERTVLHLVPSGILSPTARCLIGHGVVLDAEQLLKEIDALEARGVATAGRLLVSDRAHLVFSYHRELDRAQESRRDEKIGTTGKGIGPCYEDKVARCGVRVGDLDRPEALERRIAQALETKRSRFEALGHEPPRLEEVLASARDLARRLAPMTVDGVTVVHEAMERGERIFLEGAQGSLLDIDLGTYPFVTSSNANVGGLLSGSGLPAQALTRVIGVCKAYATRVGSGPFPTELEDETGARLRERGNEFGSTTGRPRRCGWFDGPAMRFAVRVNGVTDIALTKVDVLSGFERIRFARAYETAAGERHEALPSMVDDFEGLRPVYEDFPGWEGELGGVRRYEDLPAELRRYVEAVEDYCGARVRWIGVGKGREHIVDRGEG